jgi:hypothetical protein
MRAVLIGSKHKCPLSTPNYFCGVVCGCELCSMNDIEVILKALAREREDLHQQLMQVDRIINRVKSGTYSGDELPDKPKPLQIEVAAPRPKFVNSAVDVKIQILRVFDVLGVAATLKQLQTEYKELSGTNLNIREPIRSLNKWYLSG